MRGLVDIFRVSVGLSWIESRGEKKDNDEQVTSTRR